MRNRKIASILITIVVLLTTIVLPASPVLADDPPTGDNGWIYKGKVTQQEKEAAAERFKELYFSTNESAALPSAAGPAPSHIIGADGLPVPHFFGPYPNYGLSPLPVITADPSTGVTTNITGGIRKFVDGLPGLGPTNANNLGQYLPVGVPDKTTYTDADYYEIALVEVEEKMHSDLPPTLLRQYVQLDTDVIPGAGVPLVGPDGPIMMPDGVTQAVGVDESHYLGPVIVAQKDWPVRIKFYNLLPTGIGGDLFIPVDTTVMGSGMGPVMDGGTGDMVDYTQNRATLHLHGGHTPWISDGTPHQWITPANETTPYPQGVSVYPVPDMNDTGAADDGSMTFYYTNQQSARFMFYHDHAMGITRLNVYVGEAAGYLIEDPVEQALVTAGIIPAEQIPLVIQDKTFMPDPTVPFSNVLGDYPDQTSFYDPTWDYTRWGDFGDLWYPHVYMTVQNPDDPTGINPFGRWHYGPWFWPPVSAQNPPVLNPYYDPVNAPWEPRYNPGVPSDSTGMESFFDTPVVNGTVYPYLDVEPKAYRFRILNAANDRFWNLQLHQADPDVITIDGRTGTEVKMIPATGTMPDGVTPFPDGWAADNRAGGVPDPNLVGPPMIQIGTEGGFLPQPVVLNNRPISWIVDPAAFAVGNVEAGNLILGSAERADVIVDFSAYAGKTIILYNDAPAPFPALAPQYDYYTGAPDMTDTGSSPGTQPGWGPNTRTIMQFRVAAAPVAAPYDLAALNEAFIPADGVTDGVFVNGQDTVLVGQSFYNEVYHTTFPDTAPYWGAANIADFDLSFIAPDGTVTENKTFEPKAIQDEMGEAFDVEYGRMSGMLGLESPTTVAGAQNFKLYPFVSPPVDLIPISPVYEDGFQIWRITHNGVDTHPIHFHLYEVQLLNRVAWDGTIFWPDPNELGWKETLRVSPLMDTIVALRPVVPTFPFDIPNSVRLLDPTQPDGAALQTPPGGFQDIAGNPVTVLNHVVNFGWEYVWHCHILSHEEMDMMHIFGVGVPPAAPTGLSATMTGTVDLSWVDESVNESHWTIQRSDNITGPFTTVGTVASTTGPATGATITYSDISIAAGGIYYYQVMATNLFGDTFDYGTGAVSFPSYAMQSAASNIDSVTAASPALLTVTLSGVTSATPLVVDASGNVTQTVQLVGTNLTFDIPAGTILLNSGGFPLSTFTVNTPATPPSAGPNSAIVRALEFLPNGATFNPNITLTLTYNPAQLPPGVQEGSLNFYEWNGTAYVLVPGAQRDSVANTITAPITHFSIYAILGTPASSSLSAGWNTLSTPVKLDAAYDTWAEFALGYGLDFSVAYKWNGTSFEWAGAADAMNPLDALYINMNTAGTVAFVPFSGVSSPASKNLAVGWNLVGAAFMDAALPVNDALVTAYFASGGLWGYSMVLSPTGVNQTAWMYVRDSATIPNMEMGKGYWVFMTNPATLAGFTSTP